MTHENPRHAQAGPSVRTGWVAAALVVAALGLAPAMGLAQAVDAAPAVAAESRLLGSEGDWSAFGGAGAAGAFGAAEAGRAWPEAAAGMEVSVEAAASRQKAVRKVRSLLNTASARLASSAVCLCCSS